MAVKHIGKRTFMCVLCTQSDENLGKEVTSFNEWACFKFLKQVINQQLFFSYFLAHVDSQFALLPCLKII